MVARLALLLFGVALALFLGEIAARLAPSGSVGSARDESPVHPDTGGVEWLRKSNVEGFHNGAPYRTNSAGFRGRDYPPRPDGGVFRIIVAGDSVAMGSGVDESEAYPAILGEMLNELFPDRRFEVLNIGLSGLNLRDVVRRIRTVGVRFQPDLLIYGCTLNDIIGSSAYRATATAAATLRRRAIYGRYRRSPSHLLRRMWPLLHSFREMIAPRPGSEIYDMRINYLGNPEALRWFEKGIAGLAALGARQGVPVVLFQHTRLAYLSAFHPYLPIYDKIRSIAEGEGVEVLSSFEQVRGHPPESLWLRKHDPHPNQFGHELFAEALLLGLVQLPESYLEKSEKRRLPGRRVPSRGRGGRAAR